MELDIHTKDGKSTGKKAKLNDAVFAIEPNDHAIWLDVKQHLAKHGIDLIGGGLDEAPTAYKDIATVMNSQRELVEIIGSFTPKVVRMCGDGSAAED